MGVQKETRSSAATPERARLEAETEQAATSVSQFTTSTSPRQRISAFLSHGAANGVTLLELVALTGWPERDIRLAIRAERLAGTPILADCQHGYFLPGSERERMQCARSMRRRAAEILRAAEAIAGKDGANDAI